MTRAVCALVLSLACSAAFGTGIELRPIKAEVDSHVGAARYDTTVPWVDDSSIRIDGALSDWPKDAAPLEAPGQGDPRDLSAVGRVAVSPTSFYFACEVSDDVQYQRDYGDRMWRFDSIQFALDPLFQRTRGRYGDCDHEFGLCFVDGAPLVWRWQRPLGMKGEQVPGAELAVRFEPGRAIYECRIPLSELWPLRPELGMPCGFAFVVNDSDGGHDRESTACWASGIASGKDSSAFGVLRFDGSVAAGCQIGARFELPTDPTPAAKPQEWQMAVYAKRAGRLTVKCEGIVEHGKDRGSAIRATTSLDVPRGVSNWLLLADLSSVAPARVRVKLSASLDGVADAVSSRDFVVYVY